MLATNVYIEMVDGNEVSIYTAVAPSGREVVIGQETRYTSVHGDAAVGSSWEGMLNEEYDPDRDYCGTIIWKDSLEEFEDYIPS